MIDCNYIGSWLINDLTVIVVLCDYTCREAGQCNDTAEVGVISSSGFDEGAKMTIDLGLDTLEHCKTIRKQCIHKISGSLNFHSHRHM